MELRKSSIEGLGIHAIEHLAEGEVYEARDKAGQRLDLGRYTNHSSNPNCTVFHTGEGSIYIRTLRDIVINEELTIDYRVSVKIATEVGLCQE